MPFTSNVESNGPPRTEHPEGAESCRVVVQKGETA